MLYGLAGLTIAWLDILLALSVIGWPHGRSSHTFSQYVHETITAVWLSIELPTSYVDKILLLMTL
jgi:hypothetical protein